MIGSRVVRLDSVASTNDVAARLAADGAPEGTAVVAAEQFAGRGRQGRPWHAPAGQCICCSVILRPTRPVREWPDLSWVLAAAVAAFARGAGVADAALKHPNDVVVGGRKLAGLLLESRTGCGGQSALICGLGVNVNADADAFPVELRSSATSLRMLLGGRQDPDALLVPLFAELDRWYGLWEREGAAGAARALEAGFLGTAPVVSGALESGPACVGAEVR